MDTVASPTARVFSRSRLPAHNAGAPVASSRSVAPPAAAPEGQPPNGRSRSVFPAGIDTGNTLRVGGAGGAGEAGTPAGDLYVVIEVREDPRFRREGDDLVHEIALPIPDAVLGKKIVLDGILGKVKVEIPKGSQPGDAIRIPGEGMPRLGTRSRGDLWVRVDIEVPRDPSRAIRKLYEQIRELEAV